MKFFSIQRVVQKNTWALTLFLFWLVSVGIIINHSRERTDIFLTFGVIPFSFSVALGLSHSF